MAINIIEVLTKMCKRVKHIQENFISMEQFQYICDGKHDFTVHPASEDLTSINLLTNISYYYSVGNILRCYFSDTSINGVGAGNINSTFSHGCALTGKPFGNDSASLFNVLVGRCFWSGSTGGVVTYNFADKDQRFGGVKGSLMYKAHYTATHAAPTKSNSYYYLISVINPDYDFSNESSLT